ncbi:DUF2290 domain-containing protein [Pseudomonas syringae pv. syringae]|uniref:DUF2290 domain-containing protein n=1 Tax=Pseudomonas syringae TaxID=317 RepID=UPI0016591201|nr:DUF2290 domain-containing protein [Pseudomonas syringae]MBC9745010.1 DUF2290 domain-containing protein [Pseudomonas syringae pv. syringae]MBC9749522.1 DUF2290 domain-containing protein [Pseudomonas syringae pv. syringae]MCK9723991.1 DUF2290 domain-containing protein [Pseudomonas syringae pv. syringae]
MSRNGSPREKVREDLEHLTAELIGVGLVDDQNFPATKQVGSSLWEVSFKGAENISLAMADIDYEVIYNELFSSRSFNLKLIDGGLLQLSYRFEMDALVKHRLAYYPSPSLRPFQEDPELYMREELYLDIVTRRIVPFPLRFDYDLAATKDVAHPSCHLTLGDIEGCRIPVHSPLTPRQFLEFVIRNFYQTEKYDFISKFPKHRHYFDASISANEKNLIHLAVPGGL